eukprot:scpid66898/ scgid17684/ Nucleolar protein 58; Nucleolar protein 5
MLVLFETPAGYAIFKLLDEKKLRKVDDLYKCFEEPEDASRMVKLKHFHKFEDTTEALAAATASVEGKMAKGLKKLLKNVVSSDVQEELAVSDAKLGGVIKEKFGISCTAGREVQELMRGIRLQMSNLVTAISEEDMRRMSLGLAHSLSRYKLKFSPDKVDTMIVQAISLLDDLDKELNNYVMRCREWYGWHFPEMGKIVTDNMAFAKSVKLMGTRSSASTTDFSDFLPEEVEEELKAAAEISMGTEISDEDIMNITQLCDQILEISDYRAQLYDYLKNRMQAIAPNVTVLVGELVGARLIAHAGSLINLAKHPASTVQILGAEKALFRALKKKHNTPKYGLLYHASLVGQCGAKHKGKIARVLAAKTALASRVDALSEESRTDVGIEHRQMVERRVQVCNDGVAHTLSGSGKTRPKTESGDVKPDVASYNTATDSTLSTPSKDKKRKRKREEDEDEVDAALTSPVKEKKKKKKSKKVKEEDED